MRKITFVVKILYFACLFADCKFFDSGSSGIMFAN